MFQSEFEDQLVRTPRSVVRDAPQKPHAAFSQTSGLQSSDANIGFFARRHMCWLLSGACRRSDARARVVSGVVSSRCAGSRDDDTTAATPLCCHADRNRKCAHWRSLAPDCASTCELVCECVCVCRVAKSTLACGTEMCSPLCVGRSLFAADHAAAASGDVSISISIGIGSASWS